jgi:hypothetical protein
VISSDVKDVPFFTSVFVQRAKTGRANCPACNNKIPEGEWRVGVDGIAGGRLVTVWLHPICWLTHGAAFTRNTVILASPQPPALTLSGVSNRDRSPCPLRSQDGAPVA